ncbi:Proteasome non-ATPase 26S subunit family protein [Babesia bovis T2Bo]|uniref:Proteasome non-ATPase 26S subunit family protein n=1 Tax=Babesia bovis T2Bo TaxID=484906 RepID=UPI001C351CEB|nr:Proteasome non-ATPase 26S subunit family protein [Babesia bovis T2Bo]EDO07653.2 Proteasome non-ATPase 26S subunit family protein [Babesia bovis T2Bo]
MTTIDIALLRRFLLSGGGSDATSELLSSVSVEDIILNLSNLGDECFPDPSDDISSYSGPINSTYPGTIFVRVLDEILDFPRLNALFGNPQVLELLSQRLVTSSLPVRSLFAKKCRFYFSNGGTSNAHLMGLLWRLLFDTEYSIFEDVSIALCFVLKHDVAILTDSRLRDLDNALTLVDADGIIPVRIFEFCALVGSGSCDAFRALLSFGLYGSMFKIFLHGDSLVMLNCLEILDRHSLLIQRLHDAGALPRDFIVRCLSTISPSSSDSGDKLVAPFSYKFLLSLIRYPGALTSDDLSNFASVVSDTIKRGDPNTVTGTYLSSVECFGPLYMSGHLDDSVYSKVLDIISLTSQELVVKSVIYCLMSMFDLGLNDEYLPSFCNLTGSMIQCLSRFPLSDFRELAYKLLLRSIRYTSVLRAILDEELRSHLFSKEESLYSNTVAKKELVHRVIELLGDTVSLPAERVAALRRYAGV